MTENNKKMTFCPECRKIKVRYISSLDYCQECYRELLDRYCLYDYKTPKEELSGNALNVCELLIEKGVERKKIHEILNLNKVYVQQLIKKHTVRVDTNGEKRPF